MAKTESTMEFGKSRVISSVKVSVIDCPKFRKVILTSMESVAYVINEGPKLTRESVNSISGLL